MPTQMVLKGMIICCAIQKQSWQGRWQSCELGGA